MYVAVKDEDRDVAKNFLLLGFFGLLINALLIWWFYMSILTQLAF